MSHLASLVYVHILLMVFWIGADIGVFIAGLRFMDPKLSLEHRTAVISLGMVIDRYPRVCFVAMVPVGLQISFFLGLVPGLTGGLLTLVWALCGVWMATVIAAMVLSGKPGARAWHAVERCFHVAGLLIFSGLGIAALSGRISVPAWLAGKFIAYGAICLFAMLLESAFAPVIATFGSIATQGSTPEREASLRRNMLWTYAWVLGIYAAVLICGFLGTVKP